MPFISTVLRASTDSSPATSLGLPGSPNRCVWRSSGAYSLLGDMCGPVTTRRGCAVNLTRRALQSRPAPVLVTTDWTPVYPRVIDELVPAASHVCEQYANNSMGSDTTGARAASRTIGVRTVLDRLLGALRIAARPRTGVSFLQLEAAHCGG